MERIEETEREFLQSYNPCDYEQLSLSVDTVIFSIDSEQANHNYRKLDDQKLMLLLVKRKEHPFLNRWSLPGGFVGLKEAIDEAAGRVLKNKTGLDHLYMEQLYTFGGINRDPRMRIISCAYLSLINRSKYSLSYSDMVSDSAWFEIELSEEEKILKLTSSHEIITIPVEIKAIQNGKMTSNLITITQGSNLAFDHAGIILEGLLRLRGKIEYTDIIFNLLPDKFTITQLQQIHEVILGQKLLAPAFRRKIAHRIQETGEYSHEKGHRPSQYYQYKKE